MTFATQSASYLVTNLGTVPERIVRCLSLTVTEPIFAKLNLTAIEPIFTKTHAVKSIFTKITLSVTTYFSEPHAYRHRTYFHKNPCCHNRFSQKLHLVSTDFSEPHAYCHRTSFQKKTTPSQKPIFTKLAPTVTEQFFVKMTLTATEPIFTKLTLARHPPKKILIHYVSNSPTDRLMVGVRLQTDRQRQGLQLCPHNTF